MSCISQSPLPMCADPCIMFHMSCIPVCQCDQCLASCSMCHAVCDKHLVSCFHVSWSKHYHASCVLWCRSSIVHATSHFRCHASSSINERCHGPCIMYHGSCVTHYASNVWICWFVWCHASCTVHHLRCVCFNWCQQGHVTYVMHHASCVRCHATSEHFCKCAWLHTQKNMSYASPYPYACSFMHWPTCIVHHT